MSNSESTSGNRWLIGIIVILLVALCGAVCVGGGVLYVLMQPGANPFAQMVPIIGGTPAAPGILSPDQARPGRTRQATGADHASASHRWQSDPPSTRHQRSAHA